MALKEWQPIDEDALSTDASLLEPAPHVVVSMSFLAGHEHLCEHEVRRLGILYHQSKEFEASLHGVSQDADRFLWVDVLETVLM